MVTVAIERQEVMSRLQALVKWLAVATMLVDHVGLVLVPDAWGLRAVGRFAFPAFCALIAYNVAARRVPVMKYLQPMAVFAVVSQVPFMLAGSEGFNIFFTFGLALTLWGVRNGELPAWWLVAVAGAPFVDYGIFGVLLLVAMAEGVRSRNVWWIPVCICLVVLAQGSIVWGLVAAIVLLYWTVVLGALVWFSRGVPWAVPRGPRMLFYWFYPAHLAALVVVRALV